MQFDKATVDASGLPDLLEYVTDTTFISYLDNYVQFGGNLVLVGDAVRLLEDGSNRLNYGKSITAVSPANTVYQASAWIPPNWLFTRGNPFCGVDRDAAGNYTVTSGILMQSSTVLSNVAINNRSDLPYSHIWSDTVYKPSDVVSLLAVNFSGQGEYVLDGSVCLPTVYYNTVNETIDGFIGYTEYNSKKIYYLGSDSLFDYNFKDWCGTWHTGQSMEIDSTLTAEGKNAIVELINYIKSTVQADFVANYNGSSPTIDGVLSAGEWGSSYTVTMDRRDGGGQHDIDLYFQQDGTYLFVGVDSQWGSGWDVVWDICIDGDYSRTLNGNLSQPYTDIQVCQQSPGGYSGYRAYRTLTDTGEVRVGFGSGADCASSGSTNVSYEFRVPLADLDFIPPEATSVGFTITHGYDGISEHLYEFVSRTTPENWATLQIVP